MLFKQLNNIKDKVKGAAVNQTLRILLPVTIISSLAIMMQCSNPDEPPLRWESKAQVPISNKNFYLKKELNEMFKWDSMSFVDKHPADKDSGDTMILSIERSSSDTFETHEDSMKHQRFVAFVGPIPVSGAAQFKVDNVLPNTGGTFSAPITVKLDSIYSATFYDTITNKLPVILKNSSTTSVISSLIISSASFGSDTIVSIAPGATDTAWLPVYGKQFNGSASLTVSGSKSAGASTLSMTVDPNGVKMSSIKADDHLIKFSFNYRHPYEITDTVNIDYVDISVGLFNYTITNYTGVPLTFKGDHENLWLTTFCQPRNILKAEDIVGLTHSDSTFNYTGNFTDTKVNNGIISFVEIPIEPRTQLNLTKDLSAKRLFPRWDSTLRKSVTMVSYNLKTPIPKNDSIVDTVTLSSSDSIVCTIHSTTFKFHEFLGTTMEEYNRSGDTSKIAINPPWPKASQDSLRGRFILKNVSGDVQVKPFMPDSAFIKAMNVKFIVYPLDSISIKDSSNTLLTDVNKDSTFHRSINLTKTTNCFPDTFQVTAKIKIPVGTRMKVVNDLNSNDPNFARYIGRMRINLKTKFFFNADLDWEIRDTVKMDLGSGKFEVPQELRYLRKLEERKATFIAKIKNESNLNMFLYALLAPKSKMKALDSIDGNRLTFLINHPDSATALGFVNFIDGVFVPLRDSTIIDTVVWDHKELEPIVSSDSCSWRWQLRFLPKSRDALKDVDYLRINSALRLEGINNMDSLMIW